MFGYVSYYFGLLMLIWMVVSADAWFGMIVGVGLQTVGLYFGGVGYSISFMMITMGYLCYCVYVYVVAGRQVGASWSGGLLYDFWFSLGGMSWFVCYWLGTLLSVAGG